MKKRSALVSNSSSSSYIIAFKKDNKTKKCPYCGRGSDFDMFRAIRDSIDIDTEHVSGPTQTLAELEGLLSSISEKIKKGNANEWDMEVHKELENLLEAAEKKTRDGWEIHKIEISTHDLVVRQLLKALIDSGNIEILREEYL